MAYTIRVGSLEITTQDALEVAKLIEVCGKLSADTTTVVQPPAAAQKHAANGISRRNGRSSSPLTPEERDTATKALSLLRAIQNSQGGADLVAVMVALGVTKPKAVGAYTAKLNKLLANLNCDRTAVYHNPRSTNGSRIWKPQSHIADAISRVEQFLKV